MVMHLVQALDQAGFSALFANIRYFGTDTVLSCRRGDTDGRTWLLVSFSKDKAAPALKSSWLKSKGSISFSSSSSPEASTQPQECQDGLLPQCDLHAETGRQHVTKNSVVCQEGHGLSRHAASPQGQVQPLPGQPWASHPVLSLAFPICTTWDNDAHILEDCWKKQTGAASAGALCWLQSSQLMGILTAASGEMGSLTISCGIIFFSGNSNFIFKAFQRPLFQPHSLHLWASVLLILTHLPCMYSHTESQAAHCHLQVLKRKTKTIKRHGIKLPYPLMQSLELLNLRSQE